MKQRFKINAMHELTSSANADDHFLFYCELAT